MRTPKPSGRSSNGYSKHGRCWIHPDEIAAHIEATVIAYSKMKRGQNARLPNWLFYVRNVH